MTTHEGGRNLSGTAAPGAGGMAWRILVAVVSAPVVTMAVASESFDCLINPSQRISVSSSVSGILSEVLVDKGDRVQKGQILARLESAVERSEFRLAMERAEFLQREVARNQDLYAKDLMSIHDRDKMETESREAQIELGRVSALLHRRSLRSPVAGYVVERHFDPGEFVDSSPVFEIVTLDPLHVEVILPVRMFGRVRADAIATVRPQPPIGGAHPARVTIVDRVVDAASGTFSVRLRLDNPDDRIPAGIKCTIDFPEPAADAGKK